MVSHQNRALEVVSLNILMTGFPDSAEFVKKYNLHINWKVYERRGTRNGAAEREKLAITE